MRNCVMIGGATHALDSA